MPCALCSYKLATQESGQCQSAWCHRVLPLPICAHLLDLGLLPGLSAAELLLGELIWDPGNTGCSQNFSKFSSIAVSNINHFILRWYTSVSEQFSRATFFYTMASAATISVPFKKPLTAPGTICFLVMLRFIESKITTPD